MKGVGVCVAVAVAVGVCNSTGTGVRVGVSEGYGRRVTSAGAVGALGSGAAFAQALSSPTENMSTTARLRFQNMLGLYQWALRDKGRGKGAELIIDIV